MVADAPDLSAVAEHHWFLSNLLAEVRHPIIAVDLNRTVTYWNAAAERMFGWTADEAVGRRSVDLISRVETPEQQAEIVAAVASGTGWSGRYVVQRRNGGPISVDVRNQPMFDRDGALAAVIATCVDVSRDVELEAASAEVSYTLSVVQTRYDAIVEHSSDVTMLFTLDFTIEWASPGTTRLFGISPEDLIGRNGLDLIDPRDMEQCVEDYLSMPNLGDQARSEFRYTDPTGQTHWIEEVSTNLIDDPRVGYVVGNLRNITERKQMTESIELQARLLQAVGQSVVAIDNDGRVIFWNEAATTLYGWSHQEAIGQPVSELIAPADGWTDQAHQVMAKVGRGEMWEGAFRVLRKDGAVLPVRSTNTAVYGPTGESIAWIGVSSDETERLELSDRIEADSRRLRDAQRSARLGSFEIDTETGTRTWSDELFRILGIDGGLPSVEDVIDYIHPDDRPLYDEFRDSFSAGASSPCTLRIVRPDGSTRRVELRVSPPQPGMRALSGTVLDVTERVEAQEHVAYQAAHDLLTDLPNRRRLISQIDEALAEPGAVRTPAVVVIDVGDLEVQDAVGHAIGDHVVLRCAHLLRLNTHHGDLVARISDRSFGVACSHASTDLQAFELGERLREVLARRMTISGLAVLLRVSAGVIAGGSDAASASDLLQRADTALLMARRDRTTRAYDRSMRDELLQARAMEALVETLIDADTVRLGYQPLVRLNDQLTIGAEALLRARDASGADVSAIEVIKAAERSGRMGALGALVLRQACLDASSWQRQAPDRRISISVNVSAHQMDDNALVEVVTSALGAADLDPASLCLEITESALMKDPQRSAALLTELKAKGVRLSADDFGTGYSSLAYLRRFPLDVLKIDQSFVAGLPESLEDLAIVQAILAMAEALGLTVIAEGVETEAQFVDLKASGTPYGQGYLWSPAVSSADFLDRVLSEADRSGDDGPATAAAVPGLTAGASIEERMDATLKLLAHEIRNPLAIVAGYASMLESVDDPNDAESAVQIATAAARINGLIDGLLEVSFLNTGTLQPQRVSVDIVPFLDRYARGLGLSGQHHLVLEPLPSGPAVVSMDPTQISQVLDNLITNATKFSPSGSPVGLRLETADQALEISVVDEGPGIDPADLGLIFRKYGRGDTQADGTGIGLFLSRSIARTHGGDVIYRRRADRPGSVFVLQLPYDTPDAAT